MKVLLIRHAKAENRIVFSKKNKEDSERPLLLEGIKEFNRMARWIRSKQKNKKHPTNVSVILTSPLKRAQQTAKILKKYFLKAKIKNDSRFEIHENLNSQQRLKLAQNQLKAIQLYKKMNSKNILAIVGHEPDLSCFLSYCLMGQTKSCIQLKKGAAALIEFNEKIQKGQARLLWVIYPSLIP